jgi:FkbM family methyltransferase
MRMLRKLFGDFFGLVRVLGPFLAMKWAIMVVLNFTGIAKARNLQLADQAMGEGPFEVRFSPNVRFRIGGSGAFSGIREMFVRDTYLRHGLLSIEEGNVVVDLGANMGNFTNLALAHGGSVRVISVEPGRDLNGSYRKSLALNTSFGDRAQLFRAFIGAMDAKQAEMLTDPQYIGAEWISEDQLISDAGLTRIDFLKCDIEGGEFALLHAKSKLLAMAQKIAIEVHSFAGDVEKFLQMLVGEGFTLVCIQRDPDGTVTALGKRS